MAGHTTNARSVASVVTTSASTALTAPAGSFIKGADVGASITGTGIPAGATLVAVASDTAATLSANATASGTVTATVGPELPNAAGFVGWVPETGLQQNAWTVAGVVAGTPPDVLPDNVTRIGQPVSP
jgi:hypothetical protein